MSVDYSDFLTVAKRIVRQRAAFMLPRDDKAEYIEEEGLSLAYSLAEVAQARIDDLVAAQLAEFGPVVVEVER